ncbi:VOC family protein [Devosia rhodophyticola]|uniref:VOC family protein n=1 Tax=Devosia rhodophyticola TaxID=3026423 RepID=A0ABY7YZE2_9HYPH|nr:VOC family protein [Devosia rhodophyticola]WDR06719.1 VOC family protein [Devosia rhodophyticola]
MLKDKDSAAIVAVTDMNRARQFYETTLGLSLISGDENVMQFATGSTALVVYRSDYAGSNKANAIVWGVGSEIEAIVADLKARGVVFEHYPDMNVQGDVHVAGDFKMVWFKDPDGNILHLNSL